MAEAPRPGTAWSSASTAEGDSPPEEPVRVVPFLRCIEVEPAQPAMLGAGRIHGQAEAVQQRGRTAHIHVPQQAREKESGVAERSLDVQRPFRIELPRDHLAEDDVPVRDLPEDAVAGYLREAEVWHGAAGDQW